MEGLIEHSVDQTLRDLDAQLCDRFYDLHGRRELLTPPAPVFALEHGLDEAELELLKTSVRAAVRQGFPRVFRQWPLPFVVYAAESGYEYAGGEYWQTFEETTPGWDENGDRDWIGWKFRDFAADFGGAVPHGAFARKFSIIAWPITHAVLPLDLQRNLARLLFEFRNGLTAQLLQEPDELGIRLAARTGQYTQRFRLFCENTALLGKISAALLSGQDYESPYLLKSTLERLVAGLSRERDSREWLKAAQHSAGHLRTGTSGFIVPAPRPGSAASRERLPAPTDPRLLLRHGPDGWRAYAELPDLSALIARLPHMDEELRTRRARIAGAERSFIPRGQLLFPGYEVRLARWPRPEEPFIRLDRGSTPVNQLIADQCVVTAGPPWLFRCRESGPAFEVKGKALHPGTSYVLVTRDAPGPGAPWITEAAIEAGGVRAFRIDVPETLDQNGIEALQATGVTVASDVVVRPAGVAASRWDGEGAIEWLAGEPGIIAISAEQTPSKCTVTADGQQTTMAWPGEQKELLLMLDDMPPGTREVSVTLQDADGTVTAEGSLLVTVRDPQVRPEAATAGEGIRLLADPAQPALSDLWDGRADISVNGPEGSMATLTVALSPGSGTQPVPINRTVHLPVTAPDWSRIAAGIREDKHFQRAYDDAESATITVRRPGIGFASLTCDRGFQALRWRIARCHEGGHTARLIDHSDGRNTKADLFRISDPLTPVAQPVAGEIAVPTSGGLLRATVGDASSSVLLPTDPTMLIRHHLASPSVRTERSAPAEVTRLAYGYRMWASAERPADPFARRRLSAVLDVIASAAVSLIAGGRWEQLEKRMLSSSGAEWALDQMKRCVGDTPHAAALAQAVAGRLWEWTDHDKLCNGFAEAMAATGTGNPGMATFLLALASRPDRIITGWGPEEREALIGRALTWPMPLRAARFAVLGARAVHPEDPAFEGAGK